MILDQVRLQAAAHLNLKRKVDFGQFMTPTGVARFMATLFPARSFESAHLLDAGAGVGSLSSAFLERCTSGNFAFNHIKVTAYEIDSTLRAYLVDTLEHHAKNFDLEINIQSHDFIGQSVKHILNGKAHLYTHAILNPPYKKINSDSEHRLLLRQVGIETVNLYSAFVALAVALMEPGGQVVAIIPRSFCNGPYYKPFREFIGKLTAIRHIHLFNARNKAFKDDAVLQENVIVLLERDGKQGEVTISTSTDDSFADFKASAFPFERIVFLDDPEQFIHIPTTPVNHNTDLPSAYRHSLVDLGLEVSTGPIVDFRMKEHLRKMPELGTVPLLYPAHFVGQSIEWPKEGMKKPNAMIRNAITERGLFPSGFYAVTRRFSSKEEKHRLVASVVSPKAFKSRFIGFENHLNVFHIAKRGLSEELASGLVVYLSATIIDEYFRRFSGHTQVNATDLRGMKYPSKETLVEFGKWLSTRGTVTQKQIDQKVESLA